MRGWILLLICCLAGEAAATRIYHKTLEQVLSRDQQIIKARVVSSRVEIEPNVLRVVVEVEQLEGVQLSIEAPHQFVHQFSTELERGGVRVSPIREGSGIEPDLEAGQTYLFILDPSGQWLIRAEPAASEERLRAALKKL
ncbi:MAG: hypothetical protein AB7S38_22770 [Vulcanimicrobiota bacterium]